MLGSAKSLSSADQHALATRGGHGQLIAIERLAADIDAVELELAQAPDAGGKIADHGIDLVGRQRLQGGGDVAQRQQVEIGVLLAQQLVRCVVGHHGNLQTVPLIELSRLRPAVAGEDGDGQVQVGTGEDQVFLAFGCRHHARELVDLAHVRLLQYRAPVAGLDGLQLHVKTLFDQPYIGGGQAVIVTLFVTKLERWPGCIDTQA